MIDTWPDGGHLPAVRMRRRWTVRVKGRGTVIFDAEKAFKQRVAQRTAELLKRSTPEQRQAAREADDAQDEQDRATGAAFRRLTERAEASIDVLWNRGMGYAVVVDGITGPTCPTLPAAVAAALDG